MFGRPRKVKNFIDFVVMLERQKPDQIVVEADRVLARPVFSAKRFVLIDVLNMPTEYEHSLMYTVRNGDRTRRYVEPLFRAMQTHAGWLDAETRNKRVLSVLLTGEIKAQFLAKKLPETTVFLGNGKGEKMSPEHVRAMHTDARRLHVSVF